MSTSPASSPQQPSLPWRLVSTGVVGSVGILSRAFIYGLNDVEVHGLDHLLGVLDRRKIYGRERGLLTVCNHVAVLDDPLIWGILPLRYWFDVANLRWGLGAHDICFKNKAVSTFFSLGQVLPTHRLWHSPYGGLFQPTIAEAIKLVSGPSYSSSFSPPSWIPPSTATSTSISLLAPPGLPSFSTTGADNFTSPAAYTVNRNAWVHIFPEACCHQSPNSGLRYFKWGVSRLILESDPAPEFIPMFIHGTQGVMPEDRGWPKWAPRIGNRLRVVIGQPADVDHLFGTYRAAWRELVAKGDPEVLKNSPEAIELRIAVAKRVRAAFLALSIFVFLLGSHIYIYVKPRGSVFVDIVKVIVASWRKKHIKLGPVSTYTMYDPPLNESGPGISKLAHTNRFSYVDKAAVITDSDELDTEGVPKDNWRLCSVQQVEQLKCLISIIPVWLSGIACVLVMDQHSTFGILQAIQTNRFIGHHFKVPPGWMSIVGMLMLTIWILFYERIFIPLAHRITKKDTRITLRQRIRGGIIVSILCMVVAGSTERKRRTSALKNGSFTSPLPIAILLPQFMLSGLAEALASVAIMEFLTLQMPQSLRTIAGSIFFLSLGISSYLSSFIVNIVEKVTKKEDGSSWLGGRDLNKNRLDNYYYIIAAVGAVNLIYFTFFAARYITSSNASSDEQHVETLIPMNPTEQEHQERFGADENKKREH